uniref:Uncharacterized protein n=1 Tax=Meloidogyne enterolobii TaxID=390850 RepID=A0A6V7UI14_MELEN|nr:unnamed protein product [Meloidogyne enterolobii]
MSNFPIVRSNSYILYPRARDMHSGEAMVPTLSRVSSVPNLHNMHVSDAFRPGTLYKYRRDWNPVRVYFWGLISLKNKCSNKLKTAVFDYKLIQKKIKSLKNLQQNLSS